MGFPMHSLPPSDKTALISFLGTEMTPYFQKPAKLNSRHVKGVVILRPLQFFKFSIYVLGGGAISAPKQNNGVKWESCQKHSYLLIMIRFDYYSI